MPSTTCAYCGRLTHMKVQWANFVLMPTSSFLIQGVLTCDHCNRASVASRPYEGTRAYASDRLGDIEYDHLLRWQPKKGISPEFPDVPEHVARAAQEAHEACSINALMAAILMARTVVEATAKNKGITDGTLFAKIDAMEKASLIRKSTAEAAHEIRHFGNDMAHGDIEELPDQEDAEEVLALMDEVLNEVFQGPARTQRIREKRSA